MSCTGDCCKRAQLLEAELGLLRAENTRLNASLAVFHVGAVELRGALLDLKLRAEAYLRTSSPPTTEPLRT